MSLISQIADPGMTGLEQLQALLAQSEQPGIVGTLKFSAIAFEEGLAIFEGEPGLHAYNPIGTVHGGYAATLLDSACGCAVHSRLAPGQTYTTLDLKVSYHKAITTRTGVVRAEGRVLSIGRRAAFAEARLTDRSGVLLASATSSLLVLSR